jgi:hypothetical protein
MKTFQEQIAALPEKERAGFFRSIFAVCEAGMKAGVPPEEWGKLYADVFFATEAKLKENT